MNEVFFSTLGIAGSVLPLQSLISCITLGNKSGNKDHSIFAVLDGIELSFGRVGVICKSNVYSLLALLTAVPAPFTFALHFLVLLSLLP